MTEEPLHRVEQAIEQAQAAAAEVRSTAPFDDPGHQHDQADQTDQHDDDQHDEDDKDDKDDKSAPSSRRPR
jgi:hypothetical protein